MSQHHESQSLGFPFGMNVRGRTNVQSGYDAVRAKIVQVLFTSPGERVHQPEFGCGLYRLVFEPLDDTLTTYAEFLIRQGLLRWMRDDIDVEAVRVEPDGEVLIIEIVYRDQNDQSLQALRLRTG